MIFGWGTADVIAEGLEGEDGEPDDYEVDEGVLLGRGVFGRHVSFVSWISP